MVTIGGTSADLAPHEMMSEEYPLLRQTIVELFNDSGIEFEWFPKRYFDWEQEFKSIVIPWDIRDSEWKKHSYQAFHYKGISCVHNDEAVKVFDNDKRSFAHIFSTANWLDNWQEHCYTLRGSLTMLMIQVLAKELNDEVCVYNPIEKWTLVLNHDGGIYYDKQD